MPKPIILILIAIATYNLFLFILGMPIMFGNELISSEMRENVLQILAIIGTLSLFAGIFYTNLKVKSNA